MKERRNNRKRNDAYKKQNGLEEGQRGGLRKNTIKKRQVRREEREE